MLRVPAADLPVLIAQPRHGADRRRVVA
jgi:hypothetical protein